MPGPVPPDPVTLQRWELTRLRRRLLDGAWDQDLRHHLSKHLDPQKQGAWGKPTRALNLYRSVIGQLAVLYLSEPDITHDAIDDAANDYLDTLPIWSQHVKLQRYVLGLGEAAVRVGWHPGNHAGDAGLQLRVVAPDRLWIMDDPKAPGEPVVVREAVRRKDPIGDEWRWYWDVYDISDPTMPYFAIVTADENRDDVTAVFGATRAWQWFDETGKPYLPWVLYHAEEHGELWCANVWDELCEGTLDLGMLATHFLHAVKDASWVQKYALNAKLRGLSRKGGGKDERSAISTDPASILLFDTDGEAGSLGAFPQAIDPMNVIDALKAYTSMVAANVGLSASDLEKADRESGVAIQIRRDAVRRYQQRYTTVFQRADQKLLRTIARVSNGFSGPGVPALPTDGYVIHYPSLPLTREEMQSRFEIREQEYQLGLVSRVDMLMEREPGLTREKARERLLRVQLEEAALQARAVQMPAMPADSTD